MAFIFTALLTGFFITVLAILVDHKSKAIINSESLDVASWRNEIWLEIGVLIVELGNHKFASGYSCAEIAKIRSFMVKLRNLTRADALYFSAADELLENLLSVCKLYYSYIVENKGDKLFETDINYIGQLLIRLSAYCGIFLLAHPQNLFIYWGARDGMIIFCNYLIIAQSLFKLVGVLGLDYANINQLTHKGSYLLNELRAKRYNLYSFEKLVQAEQLFIDLSTTLIELTELLLKNPGTAQQTLSYTRNELLSLKDRLGWLFAKNREAPFLK